MLLATSPVRTTTDLVDYRALVRGLRLSRGLTQEDFAREIDVTVGTLNGWDNGRHRPVRAQRNRLLRMAHDAGFPIPPTALNTKQSPQ